MFFYKRNANIFYMYFKIIKIYKDYMEESLKEFELTPAEIDVLTFLVNNMDKDVIASEICMHRGISKGLVSRAVNMLKDKNIIETKANLEDGRSVYLKIYDEKDQIIVRVKEVNKKFQDQLMKDISREHLDLFVNVNNKLFDNIMNLEV